MTNPDWKIKYEGKLEILWTETDKNQFTIMKTWFSFCFNH